jgi:hypothetical protein
VAGKSFAVYDVSPDGDGERPSAVVQLLPIERRLQIVESERRISAVWLHYLSVVAAGWAAHPLILGRSHGGYSEGQLFGFGLEQDQDDLGDRG